MQNMSTGKSALGMDANITALLGYIIGIIALILVFIEKENRFVRYHALQSVFWQLTFIVAIFAYIIVAMIVVGVAAVASETLAGILGLVFGLGYFLIFIGFFGGIIYAAIKSYGGNYVKLPIAGSFADRLAK